MPVVEAAAVSTPTLLIVKLMLVPFRTTPLAVRSFCAGGRSREQEVAADQVVPVDVLQRQRVAAAEVDHRVRANLGRPRQHVGQAIDPRHRPQVDLVDPARPGREVPDRVSTRRIHKRVVAAQPQIASLPAPPSNVSLPSRPHN